MSMIYAKEKVRAVEHELTPLRNLPTRIIEVVNHFSNSTIVFAKSYNVSVHFCNLYKVIKTVVSLLIQRFL